MLFDPFEKQFDLPTFFIKLGDGEGRQMKIVGQKKSGIAFAPHHTTGSVVTGREPRRTA